MMTDDVGDGDGGEVGDGDGGEVGSLPTGPEQGREHNVSCE